MATRMALPGPSQDAKSISLEERIRARANQIYVKRGSEPGSELEDWLEAEAELQQELDDKVLKTGMRR
jgi:Protein of unknown function (DUF2934)